MDSNTNSPRSAAAALTSLGAAPGNATEKTPLPEDAIGRYRERMAVVIEEGRALANLIDLAFTLDAYRRQQEKLASAVARLPAPPRELRNGSAIHAAARNLVLAFQMIRVEFESGLRARDRGDGGRCAEAIASALKNRDHQRTALDRLERDVGLR